MEKQVTPDDDEFGVHPLNVSELTDIMNKFQANSEIKLVRGEYVQFKDTFFVTFQGKSTRPIVEKH